MRPRVHIIVARARNGVIGKNGALPWRLPEDLAHFKRTTMGHTIVMGRRTWESIGRALPGRRNIVLTRDPNWQAPGAERAAGLEEAIQRADTTAGGIPEVFIIGGAQLYAQALAGSVDAIHVTEIDAEFDGDTTFPPLDSRRWRECAREHFAAGGSRSFAFDFVRYEAQSAEHPQIFSGDPNAQ